MTSARFGESKREDGDSARQRVRVKLMPAGQTLEGTHGESYADVLSAHKVSLVTDCGGMGICGKCRIQFLSAAPQASAADVQMLATDAISSGWRLACQHAICDDAVIEFVGHEHELREKASEEFDLHPFGFDPSVTSTRIELLPPDKDNPDSATAALAKALGKDVPLSLDARRSLALRQRDCPTVVRVIENGREILGVQQGASRGILGLAVDIGTTTLAVYLFDLADGRQLASGAGYNPQRAFGADVITRIGRVRVQGQAELEKLQHAVVDGLNQLIDETCESIGHAASTIYRISVVGNPTMLHFLLGVSPVGIDHNPYASIFLETVKMKAHEIGLHTHAASDLVIIPSVSSYVGADLVAGILSVGLGDSGFPELLVDIGTNGEMAVAMDGRLISCSTAAGPAFEGAAIRQGMNALPGAIDDVAIDDGRIACAVIGGQPAKGICGTGLIAAIDELRAIGMIDSTGKLVSVNGDLDCRLEGEGKERRILLAGDEAGVYLYQQDVREFQLAKAAIRAGIDTLLAAVGVQAKNLGRLYVAGAFGTHLRPTRALRTGLLPDVDATRVLPIGNSAGKGAAAILLNHQLQREAAAIASSAEYIELSKSEEFTKHYMDCMRFPDVVCS